MITCYWNRMNDDGDVDWIIRYQSGFPYRMPRSLAWPYNHIDWATHLTPDVIARRRETSKES